ncbi:DUF742 domain-containing protein [Actinocrispum wychmicini]|uniref:Uncharacterized protein DUF742 n=1 Tax=Actinocrispum wychmicini TaxID=1213861 RepID=A0A4R2JUD1_9PSEU|nr:DUF742 domain-containing protein [Actinocrispum wychmicini]TCO60629.1 uncharacterized protein DUF742 [Actinocrispum wychmicini]
MGDVSRSVRPYAWTRGRTRSNHSLAVETLLQTIDPGWQLDVSEYRAVAALCQSPQSTAEVAALLGLPLSVARVLLSDMVDLGLLAVNQPAAGAGVPGVEVMERVLSGLRRL